MPTKNTNTSENIFATTSYLWDSNPKLLQLLNTIDFSQAKDGFIGIQAFRKAKDLPALKERYTFDKNKPRNDTYFAELFEGLDPVSLKELFQQSNHWLNKVEVEFVVDSWLKRENRIAVLTRKMNEATRLSQANANAYRAQQLNKTNPTLALRLAERNYDLYPDSKAAASSFSTIISDFKNIKYRLDLKSDQLAEIMAIAYAPCGRFLVTGNKNGLVECYNQAGKLLCSFQAHNNTAPPEKEANNYINSISFLPQKTATLDNQKILTASKDTTAKLWSIRKKKNGWTLDQSNVISFKGHKKPIYTAVITPKKEKIITAATDGMVKIWNFTGVEIQEIPAHKKAIYDLAISPCGKYLLTASKDKTAKLWDLTTGKEIRSFEEHKYEVSAVAFSNELAQPKILTGSWDTTVKLWNWEGALIHTFIGHKDDIRAITFSPNNQYLLSAAKEGVAKLWDITGNLIGDFKGHTKEIHEVIFHPNGQSIVSGSGDGTAKIWDLPALVAGTSQDHRKEDVIKLLKKRNKTSKTTKDKVINRWSLDGTIKEFLSPLSDTPQHSVILPSTDKPCFIKLATNNQPILWDSKQVAIHPYLSTERKSSTNNIAALAFSPIGQQVIIGFWENKINLWDLKGKLLQTIPKFRERTAKKHREKILTATFSEDGQFLVTGSQDETAILWKLAGRTVRYIRSFSHRKTALAAFSNARNATPRPVYPIRTTTHEKNWVNAVAFLPTQKSTAMQIATGSRDGIARLWDSKGGLIQTFEGHSAAITTLTFSPDGQYLLTGSKDTTVKLWDLQGNEIQYYEGHKESILGLSFLPDNQGFLTYSKDKIAKHLTPHFYLENKVAVCGDTLLTNLGMESPTAFGY